MIKRENGSCRTAPEPLPYEGRLRIARPLIRREVMELWHWHPIFVHFAVALLFTASALFIVRTVSGGQSWAPNCLIAARWVFWTGIAMVLMAAVSGLLAYFSVPNINADLRDVINDHVVSAVITAAIYLSMAFFLWQRQKKGLPPGNAWTAALLLAVASLTITAYLGGNLVFVRGVGVTAVSEISPY
jgi:uncharacterized membrane protein